MDPLDFAIYRFLSPHGEARFWAGRRVIDPRITPREIAEQIGASESTVRTRLHHLSEHGYLRDQSVVPNPALFGQSIFVADLLVKQSGEVDRILGDLNLVDGVVFTRDIMDEDERKIQVHFVSENHSSASRVGALLHRLSPAGPFLDPQPYYTPPYDRELSPLNWKVLQCVWRRPDASLAEIADDVGISLKTASRGYHHLIDSRACWWTHGPDSEEFPLALVRADLRNPGNLDSVAAWISTATDAWMPVAHDGFGLDPEDATSVLAGLVPADAPTVLERFLRRLAGVDGVLSVHRTFALGSATYPRWFAGQLRAMQSRGRDLAGIAPRLGGA